MNEYISLGIVGLCTIIYVIVFVIQRSQIKQTKEINESMKSFMDIFKIDEVKKYVEMKEERIKLQVEHMLSNNEQILETSRRVTNENIDKLKEIYFGQMGEEHMELVEFTIEVIRAHSKEKRESLINRGLPLTKRYFLEMLDDLDNNVI